MCARYKVKKDFNGLAKIIQAALKLGEQFDEHVVPYRKAPVLVGQDGAKTLSIMQFSLVPFFSEFPKVRFATHNARLMSVDKTGKEVPIFKKPTWRGPFASRHCIVPMSQFIEPIYKGKLAGNMVAFFPKDEEPLYAAGIWDEWSDKKTGEVLESFSILTDDPVPFVAKIGHDRTPVFLGEKSFDEWLHVDGKEPEKMLTWLRKSRVDYKWTTEIERPMAAGWEKRA